MAGHTQESKKLEEDKTILRRIWLKTGLNMNYMMLEKLHYPLLQTKIQKI